MKIDLETVQHIAKLARIHLPEQTLPRYQHDLEQILTFMQQLSQIDTSSIEPLAHPNAQPALLREDTVTEHDQRECLQQCAAKAESGFYTVPQVVASQSN